MNLNKTKWMKKEDLLKEQEILHILNNKKTNNTEKAKSLGFKKTTVNVDGKRRSGWVLGTTLFTSVSSLVSTRKKYPLGFDFYYWGEENYKMKLRNLIKENKLDKKEYFKIYPNDCKNCLGNNWLNDKPCLNCNDER